MKSCLLIYLSCLLTAAASAEPVSSADIADSAPSGTAQTSIPESHEAEKKHAFLEKLRSLQSRGDEKASSAEMIENKAESEKGKAVVYRRPPLNTGSTRAPRLGKPSANPMERMDKRTLRDAITRPVEFGEPSLGFTPPDWTEPLRDIEADTMLSDLTTGETVLRDNVRLRLGEMFFSSDAFRYSDEAGNYQAEGNVLVTQHLSKLTARKLTYFAPEPEVVERTFILEPGVDEQRFAKRRLSMGRLLAENIHVTEPTRELYADYLNYDFASQSGELRNAKGLAAVFFYDAERIQIFGPEDAVIENAWLTTCAQDPPHYRIRVKELTIRGGEAVSARKARLQIGGVNTPVYMPLWKGGDDQPWLLDFDSGRRAQLGYFINTGVQFEVNENVSIGPRIMPTEKEGVGVGGDMYYDFMTTPSSRLYRTRGEVHGLYTTEDRGYGFWRHRYEYDNDLTLRIEAEQWSDQDFYRDFFYDEYRNRTTPRTFGNITYRQDDYIATATTRLNTHSWIPETERLPEASFHLIERPLGHNFYVSYDTVSGYNRSDIQDVEGARTINIARLTYDWDVMPALGVTPFYEAEGSWYQRRADSGDDASRFSNLMGVTLQSRLHKAYSGIWGFSGFKHIFVPSITYSYRPSSSLSPGETPRFDALDNVYGRSRIETKLNNVFYGRDAESNEVWQVGRITLYQGNDFWNEVRKAEDYEVEMDIRPRPWWGAQLVGEKHIISQDDWFEESKRFQRWFYSFYENLFDRPYNEKANELSLLYADYNRVLTQIYYDDTLLGGKMSGRVGFAYSDTNNRVYNREVLYGMGYKLSDNWGLGFEHIYNLKDGNLRSQTYEVRRRFDCWESAVRFRDRETGFDVNLELSLVAFPGNSIKF